MLGSSNLTYYSWTTKTIGGVMFFDNISFFAPDNSIIIISTFPYLWSATRFGTLIVIGNSISLVATDVYIV